MYILNDITYFLLRKPFSESLQTVFAEGFIYNSVINVIKFQINVVPVCFAQTLYFVETIPGKLILNQYNCTAAVILMAWAVVGGGKGLTTRIPSLLQ